MVKNPNSKESSFTLIEILVVLTIVMLFTGLSIATYSNFNQENSLKMEGRKLDDILSLAKAKAEASEVTLTCSGAEEFGGYRVEIDATSYSFKQCCRDTTTKAITTCGSAIQSYNFPSNISNISGASTVDFYPLSGGATSETIRIQSSSLNKCSDILISQTGVITVGDLTICS